jgi:MATE family, multidrug efflux pump
MLPPMTTLETTTPAGVGAPATGSVWRAELADTARLALPMALTQLAQIAMMTTDLVLIGRLGGAALAGAALAHTVLFAAFTVGVGIVGAVAPLAAQAYGARDPPAYGSACPSARPFTLRCRPTDAPPPTSEIAGSPT